MVTYIVAAKARSQYLAEVKIYYLLSFIIQVQALGEFLEKNCPNVTVKYVIKHKSEWSAFLDAVSYHHLI